MGYFATAYRRTWRSSLATTFVNPVLYLLAMGVGLGSFVDRSGGVRSVGGSYLGFVAPALAAVAAATTATSEATYPVYSALRWTRSYWAMTATPLGVGQVLFGHLAWMEVRVSMSVGSYLAVMAAFGVFGSWWALAVLPAGLLLGLAFSAPLAAMAVRQETEGAFSLVFRLVLLPLVLFSGVFFPVSQLPGALRLAAYLTPLYHGVHLCRALVEGRVGSLGVGGDVAYLVALAASGVLVAERSYAQKLIR
jgi:lipooligosaccharide transport system permease protein